MRKHLIFFAAACLLCNCNLLKHTNSAVSKTQVSQSDQLRLSKLQENNWLSISGLSTVDLQHQQASYQVLLWPKGSFTFSPQNGFSGAADSVIVTGHSASNSSSAASAHSTIQDKGTMETNYTRQTKSALELSAKKKSSSPSWKLLLPAMVLLFLLAGYAMLKLKRFLNLKFKS